MKRFLLIGLFISSTCFSSEKNCLGHLNQILQANSAGELVFDDSILIELSKVVSSNDRLNSFLSSYADDEILFIKKSIEQLEPGICQSVKQPLIRLSFGGGSISGFVREAGIQTPISDGWVRIYDNGGSSLGTAFLDNQGNYSYTGLAAGTYYAATSNTGYFDELWDDIECAQGDCTITNGTEIVVSTGNVIKNFELDQGGSISGFVRESGTQIPITDGWVRIYNNGGSSLGTAFLNGQGNYSYTGLDAGTYYAVTSNTGYFDELYNDIPCADSNCIITQGDPIVVTSSNGVANFELDAGGSISGFVRDAGNQAPISDGWVRIYDNGGGSIGTAFLDNQGNYSYTGLAAGTYFAATSNTGYFDELWDDIECADENCVITQGDPINVTNGNVTANFELSSGGSISGFVRESGTQTPISDGWVRIYDNGGGSIGTAFLDGQGNYSYTGLDAGTYYAVTSNTGYFDELWNDIPCAQGDCIVTSGDPIVITSSNVTANFDLDAGGSISGYVREFGTQNPITDGWVRIYNSAGGSLGTGFLDNQGNYSYTGLDAGTYYAVTFNTGNFDELWNNIPCAQGNCMATQGNPLTVNDNDVTANFVLGNSFEDLIFQDGFDESP